MGNEASSALQAMQGVATIQNAEAQTEQTKAQTLATLADVRRINAQSGLTTAQQAEIDQRVREQLYGWDSGLTQSNMRNEQAIKAYGVESSHYGAIRSRYDAETSRYGSQLEGLKLPEAEGQAAYHRGLNSLISGGQSSAKAAAQLGAGLYNKAAPFLRRFAR